MKKQKPTSPSLAWREEIQRLARELLAGHALASAQDAKARHTAIQSRRSLWRTALAPLAALRPATPPQATVVAEFQGDGFRVLNIVLESFPGWHVGLNLFLPDGKGPFIPVLCPCGHGPKWQDDHQIPPQVLARNGFAAALFDAPAFGEQSMHNDHFVQGAQAQIVGLWSHLFFLVDPVRVADYLETRADIDTRAGFGVTGVSGGGCTALSLIQVDPRVRAVAPVCCLASATGIVIDGLYTNCPEDYVPGQFAIGMDSDELLCMAAPVPCLAMGGTEDRFFTPEAITAAVEKARPFYSDEDAGSDLALSFEATGHKYTAGMAMEAAQWFRRHLGGSGTVRPGAALLEPRQLDCGTTEGGAGMLDIIRREAATLRTGRTALTDTATLAHVLKMNVARRRRSDWALSPEPSAWGDPSVSRGAVRARGAVPLPAVEHRRNAGDHGLLMAFTDGDKNTLLRDLYPVRGYRRVAAADLRGFGELAPEPSTHDVKPWCSIDRALSDLVLMIGQTAAGMQTEDALRAIDAAIAGADGEPVTVMGRGEAALPALFAGLIHPRVKRIILDSFLASFEDLTATDQPRWSRYAYIPEILRYFDLPELLASPHGKALLLSNPLDARKRQLDEIAAMRLYENAPGAGIHVDFGEAQTASVISQWLGSSQHQDPDPEPDSKPAVCGGRPMRTRPFPSPRMLGADLTGIAELNRVREAIATKTLFRHYGISEPRMAKTLERTVREMFGVRFALGVNSGSSALFCALAGLDIGPGDEVILPSFSWQADYNAILRFGALPVFCGIDRTLNLDPDDFARKITPRTRAVIVVHFQGCPARMTEIRAIAAPRGIRILEDSAQAVGATFGGRRLGTIGDVGIFSFQGNKILTAGEGGMLVTNDPVLFERAVRFHDLGLLRDAFAEQLGREKDQAGFPGEQFRMSELTAAVLLAQFERLDWILARCRRHWRCIRTELASRVPGIRFRASPDPEGDAGITLFLDLGTPAAASDFEEALIAEGIPTKPSSGMSNLLQQAYIRNKTAAPEGIPPFAAGCAGEHATYGPELAPDTDDIIGAMVAIPIAPRYTDADARDIVAAIIKLHEAGLMPAHG